MSVLDFTDTASSRPSSGSAPVPLFLSFSVERGRTFICGDCMSECRSSGNRWVCPRCGLVG